MGLQGSSCSKRLESQVQVLEVERLELDYLWERLQHYVDRYTHPM